MTPNSHWRVDRRITHSAANRPRSKRGQTKGHPILTVLVIGANHCVNPRAGL